MSAHLLPTGMPGAMIEPRAARSAQRPNGLHDPHASLPAPTPESKNEAPLCGWGRYPVVWGAEVVSEDLRASTKGAVLARGLGRSYGDASLPPPGGGPVVTTRLADRILYFNPDTGMLRAEAGLSLREINRLFLARGWSVPVSPGTQFVTLGGMVAADVHGKNHHRAGTFGEHVRSLRIRVADGRVLDCSDLIARDLFLATLGGMGLTGHLLEVEFRMDRIPSPWIRYESERIPDLDRFLDRLSEAAREWPFTVGWIDCLSRGPRLGRGILLKGRWAGPDESPARSPGRKRGFRTPLPLPGWVLSRGTVKAFNGLYYWKHWRAVRRGLMHPEAFFYPLDAIGDWNLMYGRRGFTQYQCVLPAANARKATRAFLELLTSQGGASFLAVIKDFGQEGKGLLSFPLPGITIALDIPIVPGRTQALVDALNELVIREGGRVYLAKDAFTRAEHFRAMEPRLGAWNQVRKAWDPWGRFRSALSVRLLGDEA
jgi:decaprenylphospho-beta-D-ribofuranose 2-oxidase